MGPSNFAPKTQGVVPAQAGPQAGRIANSKIGRELSREPAVSPWRFWDAVGGCLGSRLRGNEAVPFKHPSEPSPTS